MKKQPVIQFQHLQTGYRINSGYKIIAHNISASLYSSELTCLIGANGSGKSTLLRTLSGFLPPIQGEILLNGLPLTRYSDKDMARLLGVVLTERCDIRNMTVTELVGLGRSPYTGFWGTLRKADREIVERSIDWVGIGELRQRMLHTLSDGERQKVMIAKALAQETGVIFLDEPTAFLDFPSKVEMMQLLHRLAHEMGKTIFLSTHDLELALQIADKLWLLNRTLGLQTGTPEDLSLAGSLTDFFSRKEITFDSESGLYRIAHRYHTTLFLKGEGERARMVEKALARLGIAVIPATSNEKSSIEITPTHYIVHEPIQTARSVVSIEDLVEAIIASGIIRHRSE